MILTNYQKQVTREIADENIINIIDYILKHLNLRKSPFKGNKITHEQGGYMICISKLETPEGKQKITEFFSLCSFLEKMGYIIFISDEDRKRDTNKGFEIHFTKDSTGLLLTSHFLSIDNYATQLFEYDFLVLPELKKFISNNFRSDQEVQNFHTRLIGYIGILATIIFIIISLFLNQFSKNVVIQQLPKNSDTLNIRLLQDTTNQTRESIQLTPQTVPQIPKSKIIQVQPQDSN